MADGERWASHAAATLAESGVDGSQLRAVYADAAEAAALDATVGTTIPRRNVRERIGECGPAASLVALAEICAATEPGPYLVTALDGAGAAALVVERI